MHGGTRPKWSLWISNWAKLQELSIACDGSRTHESWGFADTSSGRVFATSLEAEYPRLLCERFSHALLKELVDKGILRPPDSLTTLQLQSLSRPTLMAIASGKQPRKQLPALVSEHKSVLSTAFTFPAPIPVGDTLVSDFVHVPTGAKLLRHAKQMGDDGSQFFPAAWGIPHSPSEFLLAAEGVQHPYTMQACLPDVLLQSLFHVIVSGPAALAQERVEAIKHWSQRALELNADEDALHNSLADDLKEVPKGKNILLFKEMLVHAGCDDDELFDDIVKGFPVVGFAKTSKQFRSSVKPPAMSESELLNAAIWCQKSVMSCVGPCGDAEMDAAVWRDTLEEAKRRWLIPTTSAELDSIFGEHKWIPARRFGLRQGPKIRAIDDYSLSMVNSAFGSAESLDLMGVDETATLAKLFTSIMYNSEDAFSLTLSDGSCLEGKTHSSWNKLDNALLGRTLDLWKAYRQLGAKSEHARWCIIAVFDPESNSTKLFKQPVLAFGAAGAVMGFNRVARGLWRVGVGLFSLLWLNYFDDFPHFEAAVLSKSADCTSRSLVTLSGWTILSDEAKLKPFNHDFAALGVVFDLSFARSTFAIEVRNKPGRVEDIIESVDLILKAGFMKPSDLGKLRGRLQFAESQSFGRAARFVFAPFSRTFQFGTRSSRALDDQAIEALNLVKRLLACMKPRVITCLKLQHTLIFTDGACEGDQFSNVTCGGVVIEPTSRWWFGIRVPKGLVQSWTTLGGKQQVIAEAEMLPILIARELLCLSNLVCPVIVFVDNESVKNALIKGYSEVVCLRRMSQVYVEQELNFNLATWVNRVPTASNPADAPSRLSVTDDCDRGLERSAKALKTANDLCEKLTR